MTFGTISAGLAIALSGAFAAAIGGGPDAAGFVVLSAVLGVMLACCVGGLALNTALGPTCNCYLWTAVHKEELQCLRRLRTAQRVVNALIPPIEAAQGGAVTLPDMAVAAGRVEVRPTPAVSPGSAAHAPTRLDNGRVHGLLFAGLLADAGLGCVHLLYREVVPPFLLLLSTLALFSLAVWAIVRQRQAEVHQPLKAAVYWTLGYLCVIGLLLYYANFPIMMVSNPGLPETDRQVFEEMAGVMMIAVRSISIPGDLLLGIIGMAHYRQHRVRFAKRIARGEPPASERQP